MVVFVDRSLESAMVVDGLRRMGVEVVAHSERFKHDAPDEEWLEACGVNGWIAMGRDRNTRLEERPKEAMAQNRVRAFVLRGKNLTGRAMLELLAKHWNRIVSKACRSGYDGFVAHITSTGVTIMKEFPSRAGDEDLAV